LLPRLSFAARGGGFAQSAPESFGHKEFSSMALRRSRTVPAKAGGTKDNKRG
jgi:hypothetical protein